MLPGHLDKIANFVLPRFVPLVMVQVSRVIANLVDVRSHFLG